MNFKKIFLLIKYSFESSCLTACNALYGLIGHKVQVEFRAQLRQHCAQHWTMAGIRHIFVLTFIDAIEISLQYFQMVLGSEREFVPNYAGLDIVIKQYGDQCVFKTGHDDDIVHKVVFRTAYLRQAVAQSLVLLAGILVDKQDLEVRFLMIFADSFSIPEMFGIMLLLKIQIHRKIDIAQAVTVVG